SSMSAHTTLAPASARRAEMARPRPRPAPVTIATRSVRSKASAMLVMGRTLEGLTVSRGASYGAPVVGDTGAPHASSQGRAARGAVGGTRAPGRTAAGA